MHGIMPGFPPFGRMRRTFFTIQQGRRASSRNDPPITRRMRPVKTEKARLRPDGMPARWRLRPCAGPATPSTVGRVSPDTRPMGKRTLLSTSGRLTDACCQIRVRVCGRGLALILGRNIVIRPLSARGSGS